MLARLLPLLLLAGPAAALDDPPLLEDLAAFQARVDGVLERCGPATVGLRAGRTNGSGVIVSADGLVLTAAHVIGEPGREITVVMPDGRELEADTLGVNPFRDSGLARIRDAEGLPHVPVPPARRRAAGDWCLALGHPGGYQDGRPPVPRLGRLHGEGGQFVRTDCPVIFGDSGGPLFDLQGELIGIHSRIDDDVAVNYHVPMSTFRLGWERLLAGESWTTGEARIGVRGLQEPPEPGARLRRVIEGRPAALAGLVDGDVVRSLDGEWVDSPQQLRWYLADLLPGRVIELAVDREGGPATVRVDLTGPLVAEEQQRGDGEGDR